VVDQQVPPLVDQQVTPLEHLQLGKPSNAPRRRPSMINLNLSVQQYQDPIQQTQVKAEIEIEDEIPSHVGFLFLCSALT
jgi:hypothetical protein